MTKTKSIEKLSNKDKISAPWDDAIQEATQHIKELKKAVKVFKQHRDAGHEWPGFKRTAGNEATN